MINKIKTANLICPLAILALGLASILLIWFTRVYNDPSHVFWGMVANNLASPGITKETVQKTSNFTTESSTRLWFSPQPIVRNIKKLTDTSQGPPIRVTLESIANSQDTYQRYTLVDRPGLLGQKKPDYSSLYKLWLLSSSGQFGSKSQVFNDAFNNPMFFGNLSPQARAQMLEFLKSHHVYVVDFGQVKRSVNGQKIYSYTVKLNLKGYYVATNYYAKLLNLGDLGQAASSNSSSVQINLSVDVLNRQIAKLNNPFTNITEHYQSYGLNSPINLPKNVVSLQTYQNALNSIAN